MNPYYYIIKHIPSGKLYIGSQYGKYSDPKNLLDTYFTSSKYVKELIQKDGIDSFEVEYIECREDAREHEQKQLSLLYEQYGREIFLEKYLNRNLSPGILLTDDIIQKANEKRKVSSSIAAKRLFEQGRHNFQIKNSSTLEHNRQKTSERMKGNSYGAMRDMSDELKQKLAEKSKGNTNVRGKKWWINIKTGKRCRAEVCPGDDWVNKFDVKLTDDAKEKIRIANSKEKSEEHRKKLSISAQNRPSNSKGTIWVKNKDGKRKRVLPNNIPEGFEKV